MTTGEDFGTALAGLTRASRARLAEHWGEYFGAPPPPRTSRSLMIRAVAYKMQERALGGLSAATRRLLSGQEPSAYPKTKSAAKQTPWWLVPLPCQRGGSLAARHRGE